MPTVPTLAGQHVAQRGVPTVYLPSSATMRDTGAVARGIGQLADAAFDISQAENAKDARDLAEAQKVADDERRRADRVAVQEWSNRFDEFELERLHDPQNGLLATRRGKDALALPGEVDKELSDLTGKMMSSAANDEQRTMLEQLVHQRSNDIRLSVARHVDQQSRAFYRASTDAKISNSQNLAAANYHDPQRVASLVAEQQAAVEDQGQREGMGADQIKMLRDSVASTTHAAVIDRAIAADDYGYAQDYYDKNRDGILGQDRAGIESRIASAKIKHDAGTVGAAGLDISGMLQDGKIGAARSKLETSLQSIPDGYREKFRQHWSDVIDKAESQRLSNSREMRTDIMVSAINSGMLPSGKAKDAADEAEKRYVANPDDEMALLPEQIKNIRQAIKATQVVEDGADRIERRFGGDGRATMPSDEESRNKWVQRSLETGQRSPAMMAQWFDSQGQSLPPAILGIVEDSFSPETLDLNTGMSVLDSVSDRTAGRLIDSLKQRTLARTAYDMTRGLQPGSSERQRVLEVLSRPDAVKWADRADAELVGSEKDKIDPLDKLSALRSYSGVKDGGYLTFGESTLLSAPMSRLFESVYRYQVAKIAQESGASSFDDVKSSALQAASREFATRAVMVPVPTPGRTLFDPDLDTYVVAPAGGLGLGTLAEPNRTAIEAFQAGLVDPKLSKSFGMDAGSGWWPVNRYGGTVRPDLAFSIPGQRGKFIPVVQGGDPIGFVQWDGDSVSMAGIDESSPNGLFDTLKNIMTVGADRLDLVGDPTLRWRKDYGSPTVLGMVDGDTKSALVKGLNISALRQYRAYNDGRDPDLSDPQQMSDYNHLLDRVARENGWRGIGEDNAEQ